MDGRYNILSIGNTKLSPDKFAAKYQASFDEGYKRAVELHKQGLLNVNNSVDINVTYGQFGDDRARNETRYWLNRQGVPDNRNGVVAINRRLYGEGMSARYRIPDNLIDFGVSRRLISDTTVEIKGKNTPQIQDSRQGLYNTNVVLARPYDFGGPEILRNTNTRRR